MTEDLERFQFNTAIAALMEFYNALHNQKSNPSKASLNAFAQLLSPFAPHIAEELWSQLGGKGLVSQIGWPSYDPKAIEVSQVLIVVQVNGMVRARIDAPVGISQDEACRLAQADENVKKHLGEKPIVKVIFVPNKLINLVAP